MELKAGQYVTLTAKGARESREWRTNKNRIIGSVVGAIALPALIPGAGIGIAAGGTAIGLSEPAQAAAGATLGWMTGTRGSNPESGDVGVVMEVRERLSGNDVRVRWSIQRDGQDEVLKEIWHRKTHLQKINAVDEPPSSLLA